MALRDIRIQGDPILEKPCRPVEKMTPRLEELIDDMIDTMHEADGVGLAAPQVGMLRQIFVVDIGDGPIVLINPTLEETSGSQTAWEGCLSLPGKVGSVTRPNYARLKGLDRDMKEITVEGEELLARALLHEYDHLSGHMYTEIMEGPLKNADEVHEEEEAEEKE